MGITLALENYSVMLRAIKKETDGQFSLITVHAKVLTCSQHTL